MAPIFAEGMEVEVFSRSNDREACGWWCADIKVFRAIFLFEFFDFVFVKPQKRRRKTSYNIIIAYYLN